jgi:hypothetical protein
VPEEIKVLLHGTSLQELCIKRQSTILRRVYTSFFVVSKHPLRNPPFIIEFIAGTLIWSVIIPLVIIHA